MLSLRASPIGWERENLRQSCGESNGLISKMPAENANRRSSLGRLSCQLIPRLPGVLFPTKYPAAIEPDTAERLRKSGNEVLGDFRTVQFKSSSRPHR